uniref:Tyrosine-protein kinase n=1 Tax=Trichobilharzia regenti TaxID=157069 RepID=A0AA85J7P9_TRIRE|nr:unnamed protein product [Trichobilharzia regenti]
MKLDCVMECTFKAGDLVKANYTFKKDKNEDLPFRKNDTLEIINIGKDPNWAHAKNTLGETGLIPLNYVQRKNDSLDSIQNHCWYHGRISRAESESLLCGSPIGSFLIRESDLYTGDLTLCVVGPPCMAESSDVNEHENSTALSTDVPTNVQHYRIIRRPFKSVHPKQHFEYSTTSSICSKIHYTLDETDWFSSLQELVQFYSQPKRGLVCALHHPVPDMQRKRLSKLQKSGYLIFRKDIVLGDRIGRGEFGEVLKANYNGRQVAVKIYKKTASKLAITYEASLMTKINHPNLISFIGLVYEPDDAVYLVTEYLANGSLLTYLHSRTRDEITDVTKLKFSIDVCRGLVYLEERDFIHRDIAARNILLSGQAPNLIAKVADFGMARDLHDLSTIGAISHQPKSANTPTLIIRSSPHVAGDSVEKYPTTTTVQHHHSQDNSRRQQHQPFETNTSPPPTSLNAMALHDNAAIPLKWTAPEAIRDRLFTTKSDVWSFGILLWEIYSYGRIPYPRMMANQVLRHIESGYRMKSPENCPSTIYSLMLRTWQSEPNHRPSFVDILSELIKLYTTTTATAPTSSPTTSSHVGIVMTLTSSSPSHHCSIPLTSDRIIDDGCSISDSRKISKDFDNSNDDKKTLTNSNAISYVPSDSNEGNTNRKVRKHMVSGDSTLKSSSSCFRHRHGRPKTLADLMAEPLSQTYHHHHNNESIDMLTKSANQTSVAMSRSFTLTTTSPKTNLCITNNNKNNKSAKTPDESKLSYIMPLERLKL